MEKRNYIALVLREANAFVNKHEPALREAASGGGPAGELDATLEEQLKTALVDIDHLEDVLKHSDLREIDPELWRDGSTWQEVLAGAAMAALCHDVRRHARDIIEGRTPRMENIQIR